VIEFSPVFFKEVERTDLRELGIEWIRTVCEHVRRTQVGYPDDCGRMDVKERGRKGVEKVQRRRKLRNPFSFKKLYNIILPKPFKSSLSLISAENFQVLVLFTHLTQNFRV